MNFAGNKNSKKPKSEDAHKYCAFSLFLYTEWIK